ncbi:hypothetical protein [Kocuria rosea]|uniref:hypothetical protein n=1 Tax=Kocuria rosea TaxID=1275 RepID=UPI00126A17E5|nr:hypothetical protein [Kocuria polaris]
MTPSPSPVPVDPTQVGWNWDALSAISTFLAVTVSLAAFWYQRERERRLRAEEDVGRRRHQAGFIAIWYDDSSHWLWIENRSEQPIYDAAANILLPSGRPAPDGHIHMPLGVGGGVLRVIPPRHRSPIATVNWMENPVPLLAFRDAQGITWQRDQYGELSELSTGVFEHFGLTSEHGYAPSRPDPL